MWQTLHVMRITVKYIMWFIAKWNFSVKPPWTFRMWHATKNHTLLCFKLDDSLQKSVLRTFSKTNESQICDLIISHLFKIHESFSQVERDTKCLNYSVPNVCGENIKDTQSERVWTGVTLSQLALRQMLSTFNKIYQLSAKLIFYHCLMTRFQRKWATPWLVKPKIFVLCFYPYGDKVWQVDRLMWVLRYEPDGWMDELDGWMEEQLIWQGYWGQFFLG